MLSKCANHACGAPFQYLRQGKLFQFHVPVEDVKPGGKPARKIERFWLCSRCAATMTLTLDRYQRVAVVPRQSQSRRAAAS